MEGLASAGGVAVIYSLGGDLEIPATAVLETGATRPPCSLILQWH